MFLPLAVHERPEKVRGQRQEVSRRRRLARPEPASRQGCCAESGCGTPAFFSQSTEGDGPCLRQGPPPLHWWEGGRACIAWPSEQRRGHPQWRGAEGLCAQSLSRRPRAWPPGCCSGQSVRRTAAARGKRTLLKKASARLFPWTTTLLLLRTQQPSVGPCWNSSRRNAKSRSTEYSPSAMEM